MKTQDLFVNVVFAFLICWAGAAVLSGCVMNQSQAYKIIRGVK